jgi:hypothetical protein
LQLCLAGILSRRNRTARSITTFGGKHMKKILITLFVFIVGAECQAVLIGSFPGLDTLIDKADAIVILRIDGHIRAAPDPNLYSMHECFVYRSLKGPIAPNSRITLQLMDTRSALVTPFALYSTHLVFLTKKRNPDEPTEFRTIEVQGANIRLCPFGNEKMPEGKTTADQIRVLIETAIDYWSNQEKKEEDFLRSLSRAKKESK